MLDHVFSLPQLVGYLAFAFGVAAFLQKGDLRFKLFLAAETASYVVHFWLLGNYPAMASSGVGFARTLVSIRSQSPWVAAFFVALTLLLGGLVVQSWAGVLPILGTCIGTAAVFLFKGIAMRWVLFVATLLWLTNNILSGSIGGTALELCIAAANLFTIARLYRQRAKQA